MKLKEVFHSFQISLRTSTPTRKWLKDRSIDLDAVEVGLDTGRHHRDKDEAYLKECLKLGLVTQLNNQRYSSFAKNHIIFPLKNEQGTIVNLYAQPLKKGKQGKYLYENLGYFPAFPNGDTKHIIITENILEAAQVASNARGPETAIMALENGLFSEHHQLALMYSVELTEVSFTPYLSDAIRQSIENFLTEHIGITTFNTFEFPANRDSDPFEELIEETEFLSSSTTLDTTDPERLIFQKGPLTFAILGGLSDKLDELKVTIRITHEQRKDAGFRDSVNLYNRTRVAELITNASETLFTETEEMQKAIELLTKELEQHREELRQQTKRIQALFSNDLDGNRKQQALHYLSDTELFFNLEKDLGHIGITGEADNVLSLYLAMTSRKLRSPLNVVLHAKSGAGKSILMETVARCIPTEEYMEITSISQKSLYHWDEHSLSNKVLLIQDRFSLDPEIEYIIRELQSKRKVSRVLTVRDKNNAMVSILKEVYGPVSVISATTKDSIYEDNANRSIQLYLDENAEQDRRIVERQLQLAAGNIDLQKEELTRKKLKDTQGLIKPYPIRNPFAPFIKLPEQVQQVRRMVPIYLSLIEAITLIHQYQREKKLDRTSKKEYLITDIRDIEIANRLMLNLLISRSDMLPNATRSHLETLKDWMKQNNRTEFNQRELTRGLRTAPSTIKRHTKELLQMGYLTVSGGDRYKKGYSYRIVDDGDYKAIQNQVQNTLESSMNEIKHRFG
ncbi:MAG: hypothetical protein GC178_18230 [Flavobacteriales bacterium]|nr:hypothetical protein [Flavobacteriales bacterium]